MMKLEMKLNIKLFMKLTIKFTLMLMTMKLTMILAMKLITKITTKLMFKLMMILSTSIYLGLVMMNSCWISLLKYLTLWKKHRPKCSGFMIQQQGSLSFSLIAEEGRH